MVRGGRARHWPDRRQAALNQDLILWIFGISITIQMAVIGAIVSAMWSHLQVCKDTAITLAALNTNVLRVMVDIGTHETGIRGTLHEHSQMLTRHELDLHVMKERVG